MIITVTMNPAIDKTIANGNITLDAGGKGINVSKTIKALGGNSVAVSFLGGKNGEVLRKLLEEYELATDFVKISGETRINTKIVETDGTVAEQNEKGALVSQGELGKLIDKVLKYATKGVWFILSGSVPPGVPKTIYRDLIQVLHEKEAKVLLDADGESFSYGLEAKPDIIKPNREEMERHVRAEKRLSETEMIQNGKAFLEQGIETVILSLGEDGAIFFNRQKMLKYSAIPVKSHSTVGAGDAMVAAFVYGMEQEYSFEQCAKLSMATSAGAVATIGTKPPKREEIEKLLKSLK